MKIDVAIQSYKKPESLIYTLFSLHRHCKDSVDTIWINDDRSGGGVIKLYEKLAESGQLHPWKIRIRENRHRMGWWVSFVRGYKPEYCSTRFMLARLFWNFYKTRSIFIDREDMRYQWAIDETNKDFLLLLHDDIEIKQDIVSLLIASVQSLIKPAIVGDLGQCWRCTYNADGCSPEKILAGYRPSSKWPETRKTITDHKWACRVNEWSALISVKAAREIEMKHQVFFGNYDDSGDLGAYWFSLAVSDGYSFFDPLPNKLNRDVYYSHWVDGVTGHSAWVDQGLGRVEYSASQIRYKIFNEYGYKI
ncbi:hypothetical protein G6711_07980 [Polynucleobacter paneuropaeus]|nr:hypothetical protein [Polynucleobacter paneuropaeus]